MNIFIKVIFLLIISFLICSLLTKLLIKLQNKYLLFQPQRDEIKSLHKQKNNTPILGGLAFFASSILSLLIIDYHLFFNGKLIDMLLIFTGFFIIGFVDDLTKLIKKNYKGQKSYIRVILEIVLSLLFLHNFGFNFSVIQNVHLGNILIHLGPFAIIFFTFLLVGSSNAMNLSDGIDSLASVLFVISIFPFVIYSFYIKDYQIGLYLISLLGSLLGFIKYNIHPAKIFMGDGGSLFLGSVLGGVAIYFKLEYILPLSAIIIVLETLSVIIQVIYFKFTKKRIFLMAPLHHHFEIKGFSEEKVVLIFLIINFFFSLLATILII